MTPEEQYNKLHILRALSHEEVEAFCDNIEKTMGEAKIGGKLDRSRIHMFNEALPKIRFPSVAFVKVSQAVRLGALSIDEGSATMMLIDMACVPELRADIGEQ